MSDPTPLLSVKNLTIEIGPRGKRARVVDDLSFDVRQNEVLCIVGESGSGKSMTLLAIMGLLPRGAQIVGGSIIYQGADLTRSSGRELSKIRGRSLAMIFQDPMTSLNPVIKVGGQLTEAIRLHRPEVSRAEARRRAVDLLVSVRINNPSERFSAYPHELSGGMRQRVMVAMATAHRPNVLLADEPTTALDVTTQAQVLDLLRSLRSETGSSLVLVTHDLGVVAENADRVLVMYAGRMVECGPAHVVLQEPEHPYTIGLLASALELDSERGVAYTIPGQPPSGAERPTGCMFHPRCKLGSGRRACREDVPPMMSRPLGRSCACWYVEESHSLNVSPGRSGSK